MLVLLLDEIRPCHETSPPNKRCMSSDISSVSGFIPFYVLCFLDLGFLAVQPMSLECKLTYNMSIRKKRLLPVVFVCFLLYFMLCVKST